MRLRNERARNSKQNQSRLSLASRSGGLTFLLLWNIVSIARAFAAFVFRAIGIAARLARTVVILQLRFVRYEKRLTGVDKGAAQAIQLRQLGRCSVEAGRYRCERVAIANCVSDCWHYRRWT